MINLIQSGVGNIGSVIKVLKYLDCDYKVISNSNDFINNDKIILPGVGSFDSFIKSLKNNNLYDKIYKLVFDKEYLILGICVGMQSLFNNSEEGLEKGFGFIDGEVIKFRTINQKYKIPHIGWNDISICKSNKLFNNLNNQKFYFANSYHALCKNNSDIIAESFHEYNFASAINYKNIYGVQFHPEKSFIQGINLINNFINIQ